MKMTNSVNEKSVLKSGFIYAVVIIMLSSFWARILGFVWLSDTIYAVSLVVVMLKYFSCGTINKKFLFILIFTFVPLMFGIIDGAELNSDYFLHAGITTCVFMCIEMCANRRIILEDMARKKILIIFIVSGILLEFYYYFGGLKYAHISEYNTSASLNLNNPNEAGLWLASYIIILVGSVFVLRGFWRMAAITSSVFLFPILYATDSRNSLLAAVLFIIMIAVSYITRLEKIPKIIFLILSALPVIVFFFYMCVIVPNMKQWGLILDTNKGIDSREVIWQGLFDDLLGCFLVGKYTKYCGWQVHNSLMTLYCRYGIVYLVCAVIIIYQALKRTQENLSVYAALGMCGLLFTGCFEGSLFVGVAGLYLMLLIVPILLKNNYNYKCSDKANLISCVK